MAKKSLADLQAQIQKLQAEAEVLKQQERAGVVARIREAISVYELTRADLFGAQVRAAKGKRRMGKAAVREHAYTDGHGNVWGGRGPRPRWLREALQQGRALEEFAAGGPAATVAPAAATASVESGTVTPGTNGTAPARRPAGARNTQRGAPSKPAAKMPIKYQDGAGNSWSGRGSQPKWLKAALAGGKTLESFQV